MREIGHFIGGKEVKGGSGRFGDVFNPNTGEVQAKVGFANKSEIEHAIAVAEAAQPGWAATNPQRRARVLMKFLELAQKEFDSGGGFEVTFAPISVKVQNLAFAKDVAVHYTPDNVTWKDMSLAFVAPSFGNYDLFSGTVNEQVEQFVIRYSVNGQTFYDNNNGQNYSFESNLTTVGGNVALMTPQRTAKGGFLGMQDYMTADVYLCEGKG